MLNKADFESLRGAYSKAMSALKPGAKQEDVTKYMQRFDTFVKPLVGKYDEVEVLVKLTYKDLKGRVKSSVYRPIQKPFEIPEDAIYFYSEIKLVLKQNEVELETKDKTPFYKTQAVYIEENLTSKQQESLRSKIKKQETLASMVNMEQIEEVGYIKFKPTKTLSV